MSDSQPGGIPAAAQDTGGTGGSSGTGGSGSSGSGSGKRGRNAAMAGGALVVVAALVGGYFLFGGTDAPRHRLTTPKTLAGEYQRDGKGEKGDGDAFDNKKVPGMTSNADVSAEYKAGATKKLQLGGAYGSVTDPRKAVDWVFEQTGKSLKTETGARAEGRLRKFSPSAFDGDVLKCQEYKISNMSLAMCGWADSSTVGTVSSMILTSDGTSTKPVDLKSTAELAAKVRKDALVTAD
ncbi:hypothetical protein [Streptomyces marispadix]|uniref:Secreted protein n=1 Tax=Streptomyces marispadix TaxID=2922868 RepID=A0ABS9SVJ1_9ACTN|nr:hypothetical protein [Streptomyces marispadix]MCH6160287.1 hypothetical protein [Streptomyces marispadix]